MNKITNIIAKARLFTIVMVAVAALAACSSDDDNIVREGLTQNGITLTSSTVSSLSFSWEAVDNVAQYGYRLLDTDSNVIEGGVTTGRTASFTGLTADTEYKFEVTSFAQYDSQYKNGEAKSINVKTDKIVPLAAPVVTGEVNYETVSVSWDAVDNADKYYVKVTDSNDSIVNDTITDTSYSFTGTVGLTYSVSVSADTEEEAYSQSEWATVDNLVPEEKVETRTEIWRVTGTFKDAAVYDQSFDATLVAYDDGSYSILNWLGTEGYNLDFTVNADGSINITNGTPYSSYYTMVEFYSGYYLYVCPGTGYCKFDASAGDFWFYAYWDASSDYCEFTWNPDDVDVSWMVKGTFLDSTIYGTTSATSDTERTIIAYKDGSYKIVDWLGGGDGYDFEFTPLSDGSLDVKNSTNYGSYSIVYFYPGYYVYIYPGSGYWGLETDTDDCQFWITAYYSAYGYFQFKWNKGDVINY